MDNSKIANASRIVFIVALFATVLLVTNAILISIDSKNLSDKGKEFRNNIWYGASATALITVISAFVGTKAHNK